MAPRGPPTLGAMRLDLRLRIIALIVVPIAALLVSSYLYVSSEQRVVSAIDRSRYDLPLAEHIALFTESAAVERGLSANVLRGNDDARADLDDRRITTDERRAALIELAADHPESRTPALDAALEELARIDGFRSQVDAGTVDAGEAVAAYSHVIDHTIATVSDLSIDSGDSRLDREMQAYAALLHLRDHLGLERAKVSSALASDASGNRTSIGVALGESSRANAAFREVAPAAIVEEWAAVEAGDLFAEIADIRTQVLNGATAEDLGLDASEVFGRYSTLIAEVTAILEPLGAEFAATSDAVSADAASARNLAVTLAVVPLVAACAIAYVMGRSLIGDLRATTDVLVERAHMVDGLGRQLEASSLDTVRRAQAVAATGEEISAAATAVSAAVAQLHSASTSISETASMTAARAASAEQTAQDSAGQVASLDEASQQIESVAELISVIADQTNLLALNATIEAARAGSAGKGFSVVAGEVKALAQKTSEATEQIRDHIDQIRRTSQGSTTAFGAMNEDITTIADDQRTVAAAVEEQTITIRQTSGEVGTVAAATTHIAEQVGDIVADAERSLERANEASELASTLLEASSRLERLISGTREPKVEATAAAAADDEGHLPAVAG